MKASGEPREELWSQHSRRCTREEGAITADHLAAECIHMVDPDYPGSVLGDLPDPVLNRILDYTRRYQPDRILSNYGTSPAFDQVEAARNWIEDLQTMRQGGKTIGEEDWHRYKMEERILEILRSFTAPAGAGPYALTIYQIAIEFANRHESDFHAMGRPLGGVGAGNRALTVYMAGQLSKRIRAEKIHQIEVQSLHPIHTEFLVYRYMYMSMLVMPPPQNLPFRCIDSVEQLDFPAAHSCGDPVMLAD